MVKMEMLGKRKGRQKKRFVGMFRADTWEFDAEDGATGQEGKR